MPGEFLFEYAVIRVVPKVEREEFLNVGVILYCKDKKFLRSIISLDEQRFAAFPATDLAAIKQHLVAFENICMGNTLESGTIGAMDIASRFRWLTGTRSTMLQTSKVHPGLCTDPMATLVALHKQMVVWKD